MALKFYGMSQSSCTRRVLITLAEKNVTDYELIIIDLTRGKQRQSSFLEISPFGKVPVLKDDGLLIYESRAICQYIADKYAGQGTELMPSEGDLKARALFDQACSVEVNFFDGSIYGLCWKKLIKARAQLGEPDEALVKENLGKLDICLAVYEKILSKQEYLAGNEFTLADLYHLPYGVEALDIGLKDLMDNYPHVTRWFEGLQARVSWGKVVASSTTL
ncbi:Glutathione S-transferase hmp2 [Lachnellula suecica]|uniref:glutathione transferase n=1 Tax=Lachnellula suecica TaxID=602035 RepID=A0A8T9C4K2_9HELO|nr:Glutathione S-transferase hmp2 [Lachnellula suecica]